MQTEINEIKRLIRDIPDFPEKGVIFKDITPLLKNPRVFRISLDKISDLIDEWDFDCIVSPESRGFIFAAPLAYKMEKEFVPVRKPGKLPYKTYSISYELEYGKSTLEMHVDAIDKGEKVIIVDDVLATGGTTKAIIELVEKAGGIVVGVACLAELTYLNPRQTLTNFEIASVIKY
ncbi:MAG: adenine phosphoribosyltransferase [Defluviitoga tunisiensis]|jgi:adenine phosphoribosyltransferase|uniref:Adenine phosphoribosyltransferase n=1 Tax=Defluviitoga tunisiensis TaxID=1006576 RepID=A0A0C7P1I6_DEFTU|nr:adenine phosphoribosyltransferase [Defluviitoga tunisiensis]MDD3600399.1 adenine phosphoribosyltransferase [Defluviitoga tunisiensis]MDY0379319.1 adenine phosphoribosyltransferase [Defluviitoga tunisiensis]CEP77839.1 Adenine phosphoribosyltransferase [Defluviitoga tunisiensis]HHV00939.1 adenine phosphoribosyltransferase [Defluviitoga tunisiensis]HOB54776.1 adenine phosphoribosyltransferase [Defluviitoga tunisiensis]